MSTLGSRVAVASDHAGFHLKTNCVTWLNELGYSVTDLGPEQAERCDYPDFAHQLCQLITKGEVDWGVLVCGTGIGMSMTANKHAGIRAALITDPFCAAATREHNNANVLCMGERVIGSALAKSILDAFSKASFEGGRHQTRINKMDI